MIYSKLPLVSLVFYDISLIVICEDKENFGNNVIFSAQYLDLLRLVIVTSPNRFKHEPIEVPLDTSQFLDSSQ
jgi:hypothetical protein